MSNVSQIIGTLILTFDALIRADPDATKQWYLLSQSLSELFDQLQVNLALSSANLTLLQRDLYLAPLPQSALEIFGVFLSLSRTCFPQTSMFLRTNSAQIKLFKSNWI